jgi:hypothetical protein
LGHPGGGIGEGHRVGRADAEEERAGRLGGEGQHARHELVEHHAEGPHVGAHVDGARADDLLGRHVPRRAHGDPGGGDALAAVVDGAREAEVEHLGDDRAARLRGEENVFGLEVAVHQPLGVGGGDGVDHGDHPVEGLGAGDAAPLVEGHAEVVPVQQLLHEEGRAVFGRGDVEDVDHVGVPDGVGGAGLAYEAGDGLAAAAELGPQELDRHLAIHHLVDGAVHVTHASAAKVAHETVALGEEGADQRRRLRVGAHGRSLLHGAGAGHCQHAACYCPGSMSQLNDSLRIAPRSHSASRPSR